MNSPQARNNKSTQRGTCMEPQKPNWWDSAVEFLSKDEILGPVIPMFPEECLKGRGDIFYTFVRSIVGQQISVIAADAIWDRLTTKIGEITPENILKFSQEEIASCGLTRPKASYIIGVAQEADDFLEQNFESMTDIELFNHLTKFRGIGPWTAEMLMIFTFLRQDIFSPGDVGLLNAVRKLVPELQSKDEIAKFAERWSPFRTAASWYLWRTLDPVPVEY